MVRFSKARFHRDHRTDSPKNSPLALSGVVSGMGKVQGSIDPVDADLAIHYQRELPGRAGGQDGQGRGIRRVEIRDMLWFSEV